MDLYYSVPPTTAFTYRKLVLSIDPQLLINQSFTPLPKLSLIPTQQLICTKFNTPIHLDLKYTDYFTQKYVRNDPYKYSFAKVTGTSTLTSSDWNKDLNPVVSIDLQVNNDNDLTTYRPGDSISIPVENDPQVSFAVSYWLGLVVWNKDHWTSPLLYFPLQPDTTQQQLAYLNRPLVKRPAHLPSDSFPDWGHYYSGYELVRYLIDIERVPTKPFLYALASALSATTTNDQPGLSLLYWLCSKKGIMEYRSLLSKSKPTLLHFLESLDMDPETNLITSLYPYFQELKPRPYSLTTPPPIHSASLEQQPLSILMTQLKYTNKETNEDKFGIATHLIPAVKINETIPLILTPSLQFHLPVDLYLPMIMVATGTGLAPILAMVRYIARQVPPSQTSMQHVYLFHGCRSPEFDWLYNEELQSIQNQFGMHYVPCFSRVDCSHKHFGPYVQNVIGTDKYALDVGKVLVNANAYVYVCGNASTSMSKEVMRAITAGVEQTFGMYNGMDVSDAKPAAMKFVLDLITAKRYLQDLW